MVFTVSQNQLILAGEKKKSTFQTRTRMFV